MRHLKPKYIKRIILPALFVVLQMAGIALWHNHNMTVFAQDAENTPPTILPLRADSIASCTQIDYTNIIQGIEQEVGGDIAHFSIPPTLDEPIIADIGLFIDAITAIDPLTNTFSLEGFIDMVWCDPREIFDPEAIGWHEKVYLENDAQIKLDEIWWPDITITNTVGLRDIENLEFIIYEDGTLEYEEKFTAELEANFDLRRFPFDKQQLIIEIESLAWSTDYLTFHVDEATVGFASEFQIPEWQIESIDTQLEVVQEIRDRHPFSEFLMIIDVSRQPLFYILKVIVPLVLLVALSWTVFWMSDHNLVDRLGISFTGILTVVAYQFVISDALPKVSYITLLDAILVVSFVLMIATTIENLLIHIMQLNDKPQIVDRIDITSRYLFPIIYVIVLGILFIVFGVLE